MNLERPLFRKEDLIKGGLPKLDERGKSACRHEIKTWGFEQFLEDGWSQLARRDENLVLFIDKLVETACSELGSVDVKEVESSVRYGAALVYYPLLLQTEEDDGQTELPLISKDQLSSLNYQLEEKDMDLIEEALAGFDEELSQIIRKLLFNSPVLSGLGVNRTGVFTGAYLAYYVLASQAEASGLEKAFGWSDSKES